MSQLIRSLYEFRVHRLEFCHRRPRPYCIRSLSICIRIVVGRIKLHWRCRAISLLRCDIHVHARIEELWWHEPRIWSRARRTGPHGVIQHICRVHRKRHEGALRMRLDRRRSMIGVPDVHSFFPWCFCALLFAFRNRGCTRWTTRRLLRGRCHRRSLCRCSSHCAIRLTFVSGRCSRQQVNCHKIRYKIFGESAVD